MATRKDHDLIQYSKIRPAEVAYHVWVPSCIIAECVQNVLQRKIETRAIGRWSCGRSSVEGVADDEYGTLGSARRHATFEVVVGWSVAAAGGSCQHACRAMCQNLQHIREGFLAVPDAVPDVDDGRRPQNRWHQQEQAHPFAEPFKLRNECDPLVLSSRTGATEATPNRSTTVSDRAKEGGVAPSTAFDHRSD